MSGATRIAIVGNCQARPLAETLAHAVPGLDLPEPLIIHLADNENAARDLAALETADCVLTQLVADDYPIEHLRTRSLRTRLGDRVVVWPNIFFRGQNPDLVYITHETGRLASPLGHYHSRALYEAWRDGVPLGELDAESYVSGSRPLETFHALIRQSFDELRTRERDTDVGIMDEIERRWTREPLFHTFNHPRATLLAELARRVAERLDLPIADAATLAGVPDRLGTILPSMERTLARELGFTFEVASESCGVEVTVGGDGVTLGKPKTYTFEELARHSYACYDVQAGQTDVVRFTPAH